MANTGEQVNRIYNAKMRAILSKIEKDKQEQLQKKADAERKRQEKFEKLSAYLSVGNIYKDLKEGHEMALMQQTYDDPLYMGVLPKKFERKEPRSFGEVITQPKETLKRLLPGKLGAYQETPGYKEFKIEEEALSWAKEEELERARGLVPLDEESVIDEPIAYERIMREEDVWTPPTEPAPLDMTAIDESTKRGLWNKWNQDQAESSKRFGMPKLSYDEWLKAVESGQISAEYTEKLEAPLVAPVSPEVPIDTEDDFYTPTEKVIETDDLPSSAPQPDYAKIQDAAEDQKLQDLRDIQTTPGVTPTESSDPELEKALQDLEQLKAPKVKGADEVLPEQLRASVGMSDMPDVESIPDDMEAPAGEPGIMGKALGAGQTLMQLTNVGKTITNADATDEEKAIASLQGTKLLTDLATKRAGQEAVSHIGTKAAGKFVTGKGLQESLKLTGKQAIGAGLGGVLGGYTAATEAKEAGEAWKEKDYDEAILHGMGSAAGGLQAAGGGMMATGIGAPLGAVLYGVGVAGSLISSAGLFLEGLFEGGGKKPAAPQMPKFDVSNYLNRIRQGRRR
tara:strand:+ start:422 stop:2119 length:1698 start_codon:yes stop_codon:yes gene_type:complete